MTCAYTTNRLATGVSTMSPHPGGPLGQLSPIQPLRHVWSASPRICLVPPGQASPATPAPIAQQYLAAELSASASLGPLSCLVSWLSLICGAEFSLLALLPSHSASRVASSPAAVCSYFICSAAGSACRIVCTPSTFPTDAGIYIHIYIPPTGLVSPAPLLIGLAFPPFLSTDALA
jgi:hypothetical protein